MFKYDAFISYRHVKPDMEIAQQVQNLIESYKVSKAVEGVDKRSDFVVFRDRDELPAGELGQAIERALRTSRYLIVICSRRTPESPWCRREIAQFLQVRDASNIIAVLVEGEPEESFPPELKDATKVVVGKDGIRRVRKGELLAADVRPEEVAAPEFPGYENVEHDADAMERLRKKSLAILKKTEIHRIMATILGVSYGDITQRQRERRMRKIIAASTAVSLAMSVFGVVITGLWVKAQRERRAANERNAVITMSLASNMIDEGDRVRGLLYSRAAMDLADEDMDGYANLVGEYQKNLSAALLYEDFTPVVEINPDSDSVTFGVNAKGDEIATAGQGKELVVWNADNGEKLRTISLPGKPSMVGASNDGSMYWAIGPGGDFYVVPADGEKVRTVKTGVTDTIRDVKMSKERALLLTGDEMTATVVGVDLKAGRKSFDTAQVTEGKTIASLAVSPDCSQFAMSYTEGGAARFDAATGQAIGWIVEPQADEQGVRVSGKGALAYTFSGKALIYSSGTGKFRVDSRTGQVETAPSSPLTYRLSQVFLSEETNSVFSISEQSSNVQREVFGADESLDQTQKEEYLSTTSDSAEGRILKGALSPDGKSFAALLKDNSIAYWKASGNGSFNNREASFTTKRVSSSKLYAQTRPMGSPITSIRYSQDGSRLFAGGSDGSVTVIRTRGTDTATTFDGAPLARSNDGKAIYSQGDYASYVWSTNGTSIRMAQENSYGPLAAVSNDGELTTGLSEDGRLTVNKTETDYSYGVGASTDVVYEVPTPPLTSSSHSEPRVVFGPGKDVVFAAADGSVVRADASGVKRKLGKSSQATVISLRASADGTMVAVSRQGQGFTVYDTRSGKELGEGKGQALSVVGKSGEFDSAVALKDRSVVSYDADGQERNSAELPSELSSATLRSGQVEASVDGKLLVVRVGARDLALINAETGLIVRRFEVSRSEPHALLANGVVAMEDLDSEPNILSTDVKTHVVKLRSPAYLDNLADELLEGRELTKEEREQLGE